MHRSSRYPLGQCDGGYDPDAPKGSTYKQSGRALTGNSLKGVNYVAVKQTIHVA